MDTDQKVAAFIASKNAYRRHLTTGQNAAGQAIMLIEQGKLVNGRWVRNSFHNPESGTMDKTGRNIMAQCALVATWTDLLQQVVDGMIALDAAYLQAS